MPDENVVIDWPARYHIHIVSDATEDQPGGWRGHAHEKPEHYPGDFKHDERAFWPYHEDALATVEGD